ncbi:hypothetical protein AU476_25570 [Cupriavidus sp. UYMSc13B]|nr:hypothetical protein AU476_25570 [Cupriavidus sp. UYMSc13B]
MNSSFSRSISLSLLAILSAAIPAFAAGPVNLERWRSYTGVTWASPATGESPAPFPESVNAPIAGLHFDRDGRAFVSTPRLISAGSPATLSMLDTREDGGPARLQAFPSADGNAVTGPPAEQLRNVLGFHVDRLHGWVWALDMGFVAGEADAPEGAQKLIVYEIASGRVIKRIALDAVADRKGSFLNDVVVDEQRKMAYISDSGLRSAPNNQAGIIVVEFDSATVRRVLHQHASVMPEPKVKVRSHGAEVWPGNPLKLGINGIALSPNGDTLYWTVTTGTHAYSLKTSLLRDGGRSDRQLGSAVKNLGNVGGNTDGIVTDSQGRLYITDVTRNGIVRYEPTSHAMRLMAADDGVWWPDTPAIAPDGYLVFTASHLNEHFAGSVKPGAERYELWRLKAGVLGKQRAGAR